MYKHFSNFVALLLFISFGAKSQSLAHEAGIIIGGTALKSDYGQREDNSTNFGNTGFAIGLVHFLNFSYNSRNDSYFNEHFKVRSEISFSKANLQHFGEWVDNGSTTLTAQQLRGMRGKTSILNLGAQLEFSPLEEIYNFEYQIGSFAPYVSLGAMFSFYNTKAFSTLGPIGTTLTTPEKYLIPSDGHPNGFSTEKKGVFSIISGVGVHYKLSRMEDLLLETRFQYFNSDWVDGLNPKKEIYTENKYNDWQIWVNVGYIYYLQ